MNRRAFFASIAAVPSIARLLGTSAAVPIGVTMPVWRASDVMSGEVITPLDMLCGQIFISDVILDEAMERYSVDSVIAQLFDARQSGYRGSLRLRRRGLKLVNTTVICT